ncbi:hypothetical protein Asppvi_006460 [Aspergillus pseudoviridinutans]|uniref:Protein kinase domain-containing protein n=1 Tax=Aspergillus pseudoviridinutans TaxID=1517512 RepID=A0A9P3BA97_9EURO|nr:uncharacterized protein Asppvi_006460 [Aspergillus pseudoviridinutans]GIJ87552.1 hypothetical protein Asppvi_006460 [Aspergillus pseudoviridinutans]
MAMAMSVLQTSNWQILEAQCTWTPFTHNTVTPSARLSSEALKRIFKCNGVLQQTFGLLLISLLYGEGFHIFKPDVPADHDEYDLRILMKHHRCFGPFPESYEQIADQQRLAVLVWVMQNSPPETLRPFHLTTTQEICKEDKEFVLRAMQLDPRDRPSARLLLEDEWLQS